MGECVARSPRMRVLYGVRFGMRAHALTEGHGEEIESPPIPRRVSC